MSKNNRRVVIQSPLDGELIGRVINIFGVSDTYEATVYVRIKDATGRTLVEGFGSGGTLGNPQRFHVKVELGCIPGTVTGTVEAFELDMRSSEEVEKDVVQVQFS